MITSDSGKKHKFSPRITVFTEHGVAMLSSVLRSPRAIQVNIQIIRAFSLLRRMIMDDSRLGKRLDEIERRYDGQFKEVFDAIRELTATPRRSKLKIGFLP